MLPFSIKVQTAGCFLGISRQTITHSAAQPPTSLHMETRYHPFYWPYHLFSTSLHDSFVWPPHFSYTSYSFGWYFRLCPSTLSPVHTINIAPRPLTSLTFRLFVDTLFDLQLKLLCRRCLYSSLVPRWDLSERARVEMRRGPFLLQRKVLGTRIACNSVSHLKCLWKNIIIERGEIDDRKLVR